MLKLSTKRSHDCLSEPSSPTFSPIRVSLLNSPTSKKQKIREDSHVHLQPLRERIPSSFHVEVSPPEYNDFDRFLQRRKRHATEILYTAEEVRQIVSRALHEHEQKLREEYDKILLERLQEQFMNFSKFSEDYISRQYKRSDFSYLS